MSTPRHATAFRLTQGVYYLALGTWLGAMVMLVIAAISAFAVARQLQPTLHAPPFDDPALAEHAVGILAGGIVGQALRGLAVLQILCAVIVAACLVLQHTRFADRLVRGPLGKANLLRVALALLPMAVLVLDLAVVSPRIWSHRQVMYDPQVPAVQREAARARFDRYHALSERMGGLTVLMLAGAVLVSPFAFREGDGPGVGSEGQHRPAGTGPEGSSHHG